MLKCYSAPVDRLFVKKFDDFGPYRISRVRKSCL